MVEKKMESFEEEEIGGKIFEDEIFTAAAEAAVLRIQAFIRGYLVRRWVKAVRESVRLSRFAALSRSRDEEYHKKRKSLDRDYLLAWLESRNNTRKGFSEARIFAVFLGVFIALVLLQQSPAEQFETESSVLHQVLNGGSRSQSVGNLVQFDDIVDLAGLTLWLNSTMAPAIFRDNTSTVLADGTSVAMPIALEATVSSDFLLASMGLPEQGMVNVLTNVFAKYNKTSREYVDAKNRAATEKVIYVNNSATIANFNRLVGGVIIYRQQELPSKCSTGYVGDPNGKNCYNGRNISEELATVLWFAYSQEMVMYTLRELATDMEGFVGIVEIDIATYNPNIQRVAFMRLQVRGLPSGFVRPLKILSTSIGLNPSRQHPVQFMAVAVLYVIYVVFVAHYIFAQVLAAWRSYKLHQSLWKYIKDIWTWRDWFDIFMSVTFAIALAIFYFKALPSVRLYSEAQVMEFITKGDLGYAKTLGSNIVGVSNFVTATIILASLNIVLHFLKMIHLFRFEGKIAQVSRTLYRSCGDICHFILIFLLFMAAFAIACSLQFGHVNQDFYTPKNSMVSLFRMALGEDGFYEKLTNFNYSFGVVYFIVFNLITTLILLNIFVAIVLEAFIQVRKDPRNNITLLDELQEGFIRRREALQERLHCLKAAHRDAEDPHPPSVPKASLERLIRWCHRQPPGTRVTERMAEAALGPLTADVRRLLDGIRETLELEQQLGGENQPAQSGGEGHRDSWMVALAGVPAGALLSSAGSQRSDLAGSGHRQMASSSNAASRLGWSKEYSTPATSGKYGNIISRTNERMRLMSHTLSR